MLQLTCVALLVATWCESLFSSGAQDEGIYIRSGIVCVLRNAEIADGTEV